MKFLSQRTPFSLSGKTEFFLQATARTRTTFGVWAFLIALMSASVGIAISAPDDWSVASADPALGRLQSISLLNAKTGVVSGDRGVFRTDDEGETWNQLPLPEFTDNQGEMHAIGWYHVCLVDPNEIWMLGHFHPGGLGRTYLLRSLDGGQTWEEQLAGQLDHATKLYCPTSADKWVLDQHHAMHSIDGGSTWERVVFPTENLLQPWIFDLVKAPDGGPCYAVGISQTEPSRGVVFKSDDGGLHWQELPLAGDTPALRRVSFLSPLEGWVAGDNGFILHTSDGGTTWDVRSLLADQQQVCALLMLPGGRGYAAYQVLSGSNATTLFATTDGGRTWTPELGDNKSICALCPFGTDLIWGVGAVVGPAPGGLVVIRRGK